MLSFYHQPWMIIPIAIGFPLIGLSSLSALRGEPPRRIGAADHVARHPGGGLPPAERQLSWMAFVVLFASGWIYQVRLLLALFLGFKISPRSRLPGGVTTTPEGLLFLAVGTIVGAVIATALFSVTVVSMPLLLDRDIDFVTAMITSVRAVAENPVAMLGFGVIVAVAAVVAMVPLFAGLLVVLPVLGHATWHLYRRVVAID